MPEVPEVKPASTVVLLRDSERGVETLLLRRNKALVFAAGLWVFPGGSLDPEDLEAAGGNAEQASRIAAAREAFEESGLRPQLEQMVLLSHWTTPVIQPRRFSTWFYAAPLAADDEVVIDGGEIHDSCWLPIGEALAAHERGELGMMPPTSVTLLRLAPYASVVELLKAERHKPVPQLMPVMCPHEGGYTALFPGDAGYDQGDPAIEGSRHRAELEGRHWTYIYRDVVSGFPPLVPEVLSS